MLQLPVAPSGAVLLDFDNDSILMNCATAQSATAQNEEVKVYENPFITKPLPQQFNRPPQSEQHRPDEAEGEDAAQGSEDEESEEEPYQMPMCSFCNEARHPLHECWAHMKISRLS